MRIAFITFEYPPFSIGGAGVYAYNLTKELLKLGNEVVVFTPSLDSPRTSENDGPQIIEVKVNRRLPLVSVQFWINLSDVLKNAHSENYFDIVHVNGTSYWFIPRKIIDIPHVVTIHHLSKDANGVGSGGIPIRFRLIGESNLIYQYLEKRCVKFADRIIAVSKFTKKRIIETYDISVERVDVIYNGHTPLRTEINNDEIIKFKKRFNLDSLPIILFVGRIDDPRKGLGSLLDAFSITSKSVKSQLLIVGKGDTGWILSKARILGIDSKITVTGFLNTNDLACCYSICDVCVVPSSMEGFGLTLLDASVFGKKVVATNVGALPEIAGPDSVLVEPGDAMVLSDAITQQINSINHSDSVKVHSRIFLWSKSATQTEKTYSKMLVTSLSNKPNIKQRD